MRFFLSLVYLLAAFGALCAFLLAVEFHAASGQQVRKAGQGCVGHRNPV